MACYYPLPGYRALGGGTTLKRREATSLEIVRRVACGQCFGCRLERSRQWAVRCYHEASLYDENCFVSLTYSDEHLPAGGTLVPGHLSGFLKRLRQSVRRYETRKRVLHRRIRFFACGEYGERYGRPHYHVCLFNWNFPDRWHYKDSKSGFPLYRSSMLEASWTSGDCNIGAVTFESAAYVARYIMAKRTGKGAESWYRSMDVSTGELHQLHPEFTTMSRGGRGPSGLGGIGAPWLKKYASEVYPRDEVFARGAVMKPPRFYDGIYELEDAAGLEAIKAERRLARNREDETPERLAVREKVARARSALYERRE